MLCRTRLEGRTTRGQDARQGGGGECGYVNESRRSCGDVNELRRDVSTSWYVVNDVPNISYQISGPHISMKSDGMDYLKQKGVSETKLVNGVELKVGALDIRMQQLSTVLEKLMNGEILPAGPDDAFHAGVLPGQLIGSGEAANNGLDFGQVSPSISSPSSRLLSTKMVRSASRGGGAGGLARNSGTANVLQYNVQLEEMKRRIRIEQEARQVLQEEMTSNMKALHSELKEFMEQQEVEYLKGRGISAEFGPWDGVMKLKFSVAWCSRDSAGHGHDARCFSARVAGSYKKCRKSWFCGIWPFPSYGQCPREICSVLYSTIRVVVVLSTIRVKMTDPRVVLLLHGATFLLPR